jgi:hypothetical protein
VKDVSPRRLMGSCFRISGSIDTGTDERQTIECWRTDKLTGWRSSTPTNTRIGPRGFTWESLSGPDESTLRPLQRSSSSLLRSGSVSRSDATQARPRTSSRVSLTSWRDDEITGGHKCRGVVVILGERRIRVLSHRRAGDFLRGVLILKAHPMRVDGVEDRLPVR